MANGKVIAGIAAGVIVALVLIPKTRKMLSDALCTLTDSIKDFSNGAEDVAESAGEMADSVKAARQAIS